MARQRHFCEIFELLMAKIVSRIWVFVWIYLHVDFFKADVAPANCPQRWKREVHHDYSRSMSVPKQVKAALREMLLQEHWYWTLIVVPPRHLDGKLAFIIEIRFGSQSEEGWRSTRRKSFHDGCEGDGPSRRSVGTTWPHTKSGPLGPQLDDSYTCKFTSDLIVDMPHRFR